MGDRKLTLAITPNPARGKTSIAYTLPKPGNVSLKLYDVAGKLISTLVDGYHPAGSYRSQLAAKSLHQKLAAGIYVIRLDSDRYHTAEKLVIE